jgi:hypothetical protein
MVVVDSQVVLLELLNHILVVLELGIITRLVAVVVEPLA